MNIEERFLGVLEGAGFPSGTCVLIAFSGGSDSAALTALCAALAPVTGLEFHAARVTHGLRSDEVEAREERFCRDFCGRLGLPFSILKNSHAGFSGGQGLEAAARQYRHALLEEGRRAVGAEYVFMAHTLDDDRETLLMRVLSGSGPEGLKGISFRRGRLCRPLLKFTREELRGYLKERGLGWMEDGSNFNEQFFRNRVRHTLVPVLEAHFSGWSGGGDTLRERAAEAAGALELARQQLLPMEDVSDMSEEASGEAEFPSGRPAGRAAVCWRREEWLRAPAYLKALSLWKALNRLEGDDSSEKRIPWALIKEARRAADSGSRWEWAGVELEHREEKIILKMQDEGWNMHRVLYPGTASVKAGPWSIEIVGTAAGSGASVGTAADVPRGASDSGPSDSGGSPVAPPSQGPILKIQREDWPLAVDRARGRKQDQITITALGKGWQVKMKERDGHTGEWEKGRYFPKGITERIIRPPVPDAEGNFHYIYVRYSREG